MGSLTGFLQKRFSESCPPEWTCNHEVEVMDPHWRRALGYSARADVLLSRDDNTRRIWIEFEVSRADPVANHAKFATSHLFQPQAPNDSFVAMVSSHVTRGRRNLAANTILLMRRLGMSAFQTALFPSIAPAEIKRLNHLPELALADASINTDAEIDRAFQIANPISSIGNRDLHYAGDLMDVYLNVRSWNNEIESSQGQSLWGKRTVTYFVYDIKSGQFAPSKFCAYINLGQPSALKFLIDQQLMTMQSYCSLDENEPKFDGNLAQKHLQRQLNLKLIDSKQSRSVDAHFTQWLAKRSNSIRIHPRGPKFLIPPDWYA
jgi:hypothetical protein